jgi:hypothetical protein
MTRISTTARVNLISGLISSITQIWMLRKINGLIKRIVNRKEKGESFTWYYKLGEIIK